MPDTTPHAHDEHEGPELSIVTPLDVPGQPRLDLDRALEAILFIADEPLLGRDARGRGRAPGGRGARVDRPPARRLRRSGRVGRAAHRRRRRGACRRGIRRGFELREVGGGWRFYVRAEYDALVADFVLTQTSTRLSQAALETLSVIAYKQPISRSSIASIRAVNVDSVVRTLLGRGLITEVCDGCRDGRDPLRHDRPAAHQARHQLARRAAAHLAVARRRPGGIRP